MRGAANRGVALTTGGMGDKRMSLTPVSKRKSKEPLPKPKKKKKAAKAKKISGCDLCGSGYRTRPTVAGKRCFDCWREEEKLLMLWSNVPRNHKCTDQPTRATCNLNSHLLFHRAAVSFTIKIHQGSTATGPVIESIRTQSNARAEAHRIRKLHAQEQNFESARALEAERAKARMEEHALAQAADVAQREARARRLQNKTYRETPLEDLREAMSKLQSQWNER